MANRFNPTLLLLAFGLGVLAIAGLSIADMFLQRPYDGVVLAVNAKTLIVGEVIRGSGADVAGIEPGDTILGIARTPVRNPRDAARALSRMRIGDRVPYLVRTAEGLEEVDVHLSRRSIGDSSYLYAAVLGFSFFLVGLFVLIRQPTLRASQVFFLLCGLFLLFLVCRMRPPSYSGVDSVVLSIGTLAMLFLPPALLHFYLLFPRPAWLEASLAVNGEGGGLRRAVARSWQRAWPLAYALPPVVFGAVLLEAKLRGRSPALISGVPAANWWLLPLYILLGFLALRANARRVDRPHERRGMALVIIGSLFGLGPFLLATVLFPTFQHSRAFFFFGIMPLVLVPITFAYATVRFQLLDIRVILRRSLLYTVTTALVTVLYAGAIAAFNAFFRGSTVATSAYFPILLALAIVLLFDPLRRRVQALIDRFFFAERARLQAAMVELGEALTAQVDLQPVVRELVERLPQLLNLRFAALYLVEGERLRRVAGPTGLPAELPHVPALARALTKRKRITRFEQLGTLRLRLPAVEELVRTLEATGVEALGLLASRRRTIGLVMLASKAESRIPLEREELELLQGLLHQASLALETHLLLEERTQQAELERELTIAASIQERLLPARLDFAPGWSVRAACRPARDVGGDFFTQLPAPNNGNQAVVFGDVSGKSVSGALMMMAAHEVLHALALAQPEPSKLFELANRRLYSLGRRSFLALGYFCACAAGDRLRYVVAGQPAPLLRAVNATVRELPLPEHRLPLGAMQEGLYGSCEVAVAPGEVVLGYSDGVIDARAPDGTFFGSERLEEVVASAAASPGAIVDAVLAAVHTFTRGAPRYDDLTLVAVGRQPENQP